MNNGFLKEVLLIEPPTGPHILANAKCPPLGIGYIAAELRSKGYDLRFEDLDACNTSLILFERKLRAMSPKLIGISCSFWSQGTLPTITRLIRQSCPDAVISCGGLLPRFDPVAFLNDNPDIDIVIGGEGESTFLEICDALSDPEKKFNRAVAEINGIVYRSNGQVRKNDDRPVNLRIDEMASPFLHDIYDFDRYTEPVMLLTARGCPYNCIYCLWGSPRYSYRQHSIDYVIRDLIYLHNKGIKNISFGDGTFNISTRRLEELKNKLIGNHLAFNIHDADCRADLFDEKQAAVLKEMGVIDLGFGLETIHGETQKLIRKHMNPIAVSRAVSIAKSYGFSTHVSIMIGLPGETEEHVLETFAFVDDLSVDFVGVFPLRIQSGTELADMQQKKKSKGCPMGKWRVYSRLQTRNSPW